MPAFGFSVGDVIGGIEFIYTLIQALEESAGSRSKYRGVISALKSSNDVLTQIDGLQLPKHLKAEVDKILKRYEDTTLDFAKKIGKYDRCLGDEATGKSFKTFLRKVHWQRYGEKEVIWFQDQLQQHSSALQLVLFRVKHEEDNTARKQLQDGLQELSGKLGSQHTSLLQAFTLFFVMLLGLRQLMQTVLLTLSCIASHVKRLQKAALTISRNTIAQTVVIFEDAHGKAYRLNTDFITNWQVFKVALCQVFVDRPGWQRVVREQFRLHDSFSGHDIDMALPFEAVFRPGRQIAMDIFFEWNEATQGDCQRCGSSDVSSGKGGSVCSKCGFKSRKLLGGAAGALQSPTIAFGPGCRRKAAAKKRAVTFPKFSRQPAPAQNKGRHPAQPPLNDRSTPESVDKPSDFARICIGPEPGVTLYTLDGKVHTVPWPAAVTLKARLTRASLQIYTFESALAHLLRGKAPSQRSSLTKNFRYVTLSGAAITNDNWVEALEPGLCVVQGLLDESIDQRQDEFVPSIRHSAYTQGSSVRSSLSTDDDSAEHQRTVIAHEMQATATGEISAGQSRRSNLVNLRAAQQSDFDEPSLAIAQQQAELLEQQRQANAEGFKTLAASLDRLHLGHAQGETPGRSAVTSAARDDNQHVSQASDGSVVRTTPTLETPVNFLANAGNEAPKERLLGLLANLLHRPWPTDPQHDTDEEVVFDEPDDRASATDRAVCGTTWFELDDDGARRRRNNEDPNVDSLRNRV